ncbi:hypothetical protein SAMN04487885_1462 [Clostridium cadaveris]|uniref:DNA (cytosine-5-)-methyltransferase n=1 Tax=Clostridium cadaveris TaxID=1529 RepID=A0A1I2QQ39_9CLOT|nr:DNA cytosine methyltransferase [Clostridium cadaveris]SFG29409.1 hypothetical protein SAMN04487885_1462 [Clostridium cadaveris]
MDNSNKIILDLCGGTGSWSKPYKDAGYDVRVITLPEYDVCQYEPPKDVYGILAAPPCTHFSIACNRLWEQKDKDGRTIEGLKVLIACLKIIAKCNPKFWTIENPVGRMKHFLGEPQYKFLACDFGFPTKKKTYIWGNFNIPQKPDIKVEKIYKVEEIDYLAKELFQDYRLMATDHSKRAAIRSITPPGFAKAFFEANR